MTQQEVMDQITIIVDRIAPRYTFYGYELDDIKQESYIICIDGLERYEEGRPLENFLSVHLSKRLKNVIRNNHFNKGDDEDKKRVKMPGQLANEESSHYYDTTMLDSMDAKEMCDIVDRQIPYEHRENYLKMINNVHVPKKEKEELVEIIKKIVEDSGYEVNYE